MLLKELFEKFDVKCPNWLKNKQINDDWADGKYSNENNTHKWTLDNPFQNLIITFDGETYTFRGFDDEGLLLIENTITKDMYTIT